MVYVPPRVLMTQFFGVDPAWTHDRFAVALIEVAIEATDAAVDSGWAWRAGVQEPGWVWPSQLNAKAVAEGVTHNYLLGRKPDPPFALRRLVQFTTDAEGNSEDKATRFLRRAISHPAVK